MLWPGVFPGRAIGVAAVTRPLAERGARVVLLDIEGTTTPIAFVHDVLFPYARRHLDAFLLQQAGTADALEIEQRLRGEHADDVSRGDAPPPIAPSVAPYLHWLMDRDRKSPGLKRLQGLVWEQGYQRGELRGQVFADVPDAIRRWRAAGLTVAIYSSGSELAQRRLFQSTDAGDLTHAVAHFFDTAVGAKVSADSYRHIVGTLNQPAGSVVFISDVTAELSAARAAGLATLLSVRPGNAPQTGAEDFEAVTNFEGL